VCSWNVAEDTRTDWAHFQTRDSESERTDTHIDCSQLFTGHGFLAKTPRRFHYGLDVPTDSIANNYHNVKWESNQNISLCVGYRCAKGEPRKCCFYMDFSSHGHKWNNGAKVRHMLPLLAFFSGGYSKNADVIVIGLRENLNGSFAGSAHWRRQWRSERYRTSFDNALSAMQKSSIGVRFNTMGFLKLHHDSRSKHLSRYVVIIAVLFQEKDKSVFWIPLLRPVLN
jgi:hypothetical protein